MASISQLLTKRPSKRSKPHSPSSSSSSSSSSFEPSTTTTTKKQCTSKIKRDDARYLPLEYRTMVNNETSLVCTPSGEIMENFNFNPKFYPLDEENGILVFRFDAHKTILDEKGEGMYEEKESKDEKLLKLHRGVQLMAHKALEDVVFKSYFTYGTFAPRLHAIGHTPDTSNPDSLDFIARNKELEHYKFGGVNHQSTELNAEQVRFAEMMLRSVEASRAYFADSPKEKHRKYATYFPAKLNRERLSAVFNLYRAAFEGGGSVSDHSDNESLKRKVCPRPWPVVLSYSVGMARELVIKIAGTSTVVKRIVLEPHHMVAMIGRTFQEKYTHAVPKITTAKKLNELQITGGITDRISITIRAEEKKEEEE